MSRAPYLKALAFYPQGSCWNGGGLFTAKRKYWLNCCGEPTRVTKEVTEDTKFVLPVRYNNECLGVYYPRLLRDGWSLVGRYPSRDVFDKPIGEGWILRKIAHSQVRPPMGKGCYWDEHALIHKDSGVDVRKPGWEWADVDRRARLVWAERGRLFAGRVGDAGLVDENELYDFNAMEFEAIEAPY